MLRFVHCRPRHHPDSTLVVETFCRYGVGVCSRSSPEHHTTDNLCEGRISPAQDGHRMAHSSSRDRPNNGRPASAARNPYAAIAATITRARTDGNTYQREKSRDGTPLQISDKTLSATAKRKMPYWMVSKITTAATDSRDEHVHHRMSIVVRRCNENNDNPHHDPDEPVAAEQRAPDHEQHRKKQNVEGSLKSAPRW